MAKPGRGALLECIISLRVSGVSVLLPAEDNAHVKAPSSIFYIATPHGVENKNVC